MKSPRSRHIPPTPETLAKAALNYLGRYAASEDALRRVLENRLRRAALQNREFAADKETQLKLRGSIEDIIARHRKTGTLNDAAYAETKVNSLRRAGRSARAIHQRLGHAGVGKDVIDNALDGQEDGLNREEAEIKAALSLARRRKLGSFRRGGGDQALYRKDLAVLARAGFSLGIARKILEGQGLLDEDGVEDWDVGLSGVFSAK